MANQNWAAGIVPIHQISGGAPITEAYPVKSGYATDIYKHSVVIFDTATGKIKMAATTGPTDVIGVAATPYLVGKCTPSKILVWRGDQHVFRIQADSGGASSANSVTDVLQKNFPLLNQASGSTITGLSTCEADFSNRVYTDNLLRCVGVDQEAGGTEGGKNMKLLVQFNSGRLYGAGTRVY